VVTTSVTVRNSNSFDPPNIRVSPGATVTWTWQGTTDDEHNVYFASAAISDSPDQRSGTFQATMPTQAGTYNYECQHHSGMNGSVVVQ
jgi:plastocyanin